MLHLAISWRRNPLPAPSLSVCFLTLLVSVASLALPCFSSAFFFPSLSSFFFTAPTQKQPHNQCVGALWLSCIQVSWSKRQWIIQFPNLRVCWFANFVQQKFSLFPERLKKQVFGIEVLCCWIKKNMKMQFWCPKCLLALCTPIHLYHNQ